jgi:hypothetical protein
MMDLQALLAFRVLQEHLEIVALQEVAVAQEKMEPQVVLGPQDKMALAVVRVKTVLQELQEAVVLQALQVKMDLQALRAHQVLQA